MSAFRRCGGAGNVFGSDSELIYTDEYLIQMQDIKIELDVCWFKCQTPAAEHPRNTNPRIQYRRASISNQSPNSMIPFIFDPPEGHLTDNILLYGHMKFIVLNVYLGDWKCMVDKIHFTKCENQSNSYYIPTVLNRYCLYDTVIWPWKISIRPKGEYGNKADTECLLSFDRKFSFSRSCRIAM